MQFMRSILYGVSPTRRERYLPPVSVAGPVAGSKSKPITAPLTINRYVIAAG